MRVLISITGVPAPVEYGCALIGSAREGLK